MNKPTECAPRRCANRGGFNQIVLKDELEQKPKYEIPELLRWGRRRSADFQSAVSQVFNLLATPTGAMWCRLQVRDTADCKSALPQARRGSFLTLVGRGGFECVRRRRRKPRGG